MLVMSVLHASLEPAILEAYSYCETAKELWDTLKKVYGNTSNLNRVFEIDMIMESTKEWKHEPEPEELVAEDATLRNAWKQEEYIGLGRSLIIQDTFTIIQATPPSS